jgi:hypothetical protein
MSLASGNRFREKDTRKNKDLKRGKRIRKIATRQSGPQRGGVLWLDRTVALPSLFSQPMPYRLATRRELHD